MLELTTISCNATKPFNIGSATFRDSINESIISAVKKWNDVQLHNILTMKIVTDYLVVIKYLIMRSNKMVMKNLLYLKKKFVQHLII
jgi:hypothetical protein